MTCMCKDFFFNLKKKKHASERKELAFNDFLYT